MPLGTARLNTLSRFVASGSRQEITIDTVGDTQISTSQNQFGSASAFFDGTGDYLVIQEQVSPDLSGDFTFEAWVYPTSVSGNGKIFDFRGLDAGPYDDNKGLALGSTLLIDRNGSDFRCFVDGSDRATLTSGEFTVNQWHHVAVQRSSGTINAWVEGTRAVNYTGSDDYSTIFERNQPIGCNGFFGGETNFFTGYMDEIRFSDTARYTNGSSITVPTSAFTNDSDTFLLLHCEGTNGSTDFEDDNA